MARSTDNRTVIVSFVPPKVFLTDKAPYFLFPRGDLFDQLYLYGVLRSIPLDWYARRFVETGVKFFIISAFPIPRPPRDSVLWKRITEISARLAAVDSRFEEIIALTGCESGEILATDKDDLTHELDAVVALLYGLEEKHLIHIFETFHEGWDYQGRLDATLKHFRSWAK